MEIAVISRGSMFYNILNLKNKAPLFSFFYLHLIKPRYDIHNVHDKYSKCTHARNRTGTTGQTGFARVALMLSDIKSVSINLHCI